MTSLQKKFEEFIHDHPEFEHGTPCFAEFYLGLEPIELERVEKLWEIALNLNRETTAAELAESLIRTLPDEEDGSGGVVVRDFAEALLGRAQRDDSGGGNLYLDGRPPGSQLRAFELLRRRTPLIPFAYAAANKAILDVLEDYDEEAQDVTLIDVGVGRGGQLRALVHSPAAQRLIKNLHIIAIEPDSSPSDNAGALEIARDKVLMAGREAGIEITFCGIPQRAESLTIEQITSANPRGTIIANSSFTLHHIGDQKNGHAASRKHLLEILRTAGARALIVVEPDSNHTIDDLILRLFYAYRHYRSVFNCLQTILPSAEAGLVWNEFYAPEVLNVIGHDGSRRTERHEETSCWQQRIESAGWNLDQLEEILPQAAAPPGFSVGSQGAVFGLEYRNVRLLGVLRGRAQ